MIKHVYDNIENKEFIDNDKNIIKFIINVLQHVKFYFYFTEEKMFKKLFINQIMFAAIHVDKYHK